MSDWQHLVRCGNVPALLPMAGSNAAPIPLSLHDLHEDGTGRKYIKLNTRSLALVKFLCGGTGRDQRAPTERNYVRIYLRTYVRLMRSPA